MSDSDLHIPLKVEPLCLGLKTIGDYHNSPIAQVNDHEVRLSVMTGSYPWHCHPTSDEMFTVLDGELLLEFEHGQVTLKPGQYLTVPKGTFHRTSAVGERVISLTFERVDSETVFRS